MRPFDVKYKIWQKSPKKWLTDEKMDVCVCPDGTVLAGDLGDSVTMLYPNDIDILFYTGFTTPEGDVYQGDIIGKEFHQSMYVDYVQGAYVCKSTDKVQRVNWNPIPLKTMINDYGFTIEGNIYDNPEMIEGEI